MLRPAWPRSLPADPAWWRVQESPLCQQGHTASSRLCLELPTQPSGSPKPTREAPLPPAPSSPPPSLLRLLRAAGIQRPVLELQTRRSARTPSRFSPPDLRCACAAAPRGAGARANVERGGSACTTRCCKGDGPVLRSYLRDIAAELALLGFRVFICKIGKIISALSDVLEETNETLEDRFRY